MRSGSITATQLEIRTKILGAFTSSSQCVQELLSYNSPAFNKPIFEFPCEFPLPDEPFVKPWQEYEHEAEKSSAFDILKEKLPHFRFPIRPGISQTRAYKVAMKTGILEQPDQNSEPADFQLENPKLLRIIVHQSPAGKIPVLLTKGRNDFVSVMQAITRRSEPTPIADSIGACMISGYNNWDRINTLKQEWQNKSQGNGTRTTWPQKFASIVKNVADYQDRFIILSDGVYSGIEAADLGLEGNEWKKLSIRIRLNHECTHYFTRRFWASMKNKAIDELMADYIGLFSAFGKYEAAMFLKFMGLEDFPKLRNTGRLHSYRGNPPLSDQAFKILQTLLLKAAQNLEQFCAIHGPPLNTPAGHAALIATLATFTLEELASSDIVPKLCTELQTYQAAAA